MRVLVISLVLVAGLQRAIFARQHQPSARVRATAKQAQNTDTNSPRKPCFEEQEIHSSEQQESEAVDKLPNSFRYWLVEDAVYIISPEERCAFLHLGTDRERQQFIEHFWVRRASDSESPDNDFKREHYRRILFANEQFAANVPGWQTDRGRMYITFGPPDKIESHGGGSQDAGHDVERRETWHYRYLEGLGPNIDMDFADASHSSDYRLTTPIQATQEPLWNLPGISRQLCDVAVGTSQRIVFYIGLVRPPRIKFKDLEAMVVARVARDQIYFNHKIAFTKATHASTMVDITVVIPPDQLTLSTRNGAQLSGAEIFGRISKPSGWVVETFERTRSDDKVAKPAPKPDATVPLAPGAYTLAIAVKDLASGTIGVVHTTFNVPGYDDL